MSVDSNRLGQLFYCPSVGITTQVQRSVPRPQTHALEQSKLLPHSSSSSPFPSSSSSSPSSSSSSSSSNSLPMSPLILIRPPSRSNLPPQAPNSIPSSPGSVKMLNITITRKRLKVTAGANELPISILKPIAQSFRTIGGKIRKFDVVPPLPLPPKIQAQTASALSSSSTTKTNLQAQCPIPSPSTLAITAPPPPPPPPPNQALPTGRESNAPSTVSVSPSTQIQLQPPQTQPLTAPEATVIPEITELCPYCDTYFYTYNTLTLHLLTVHYATPISNVKTCPICKIVYRDYSEYAFHCLHSHSSLPHSGIQMECLVSVASPVYPIYRKCLICNQTFTSTRAIMIHFAEHLGPATAYQCRFCQNHVIDLWPLVVHLRRAHLVKFKYPTKPRVPQEATQETQFLSSNSPTTTSIATANGTASTGAISTTTSSTS